MKKQILGVFAVYILILSATAVFAISSNRNEILTETISNDHARISISVIDGSLVIQKFSSIQEICNSADTSAEVYSEECVGKIALWIIINGNIHGNSGGVNHTVQKYPYLTGV